MQELIGQNLDRYRIMRMLGEGGMGAVLHASDDVLQREVAVKVMHAQFGRQSDFRDRFLQEARTAARLDHPGIVKVFDFGEDRGLLYIVMELIPGDNLRVLLKSLQSNGKWILLAEAVRLVRQLSLALHYAHHMGVLHRDLKPDNIMLKPEPSDGLPYHPVITDLGLAKLAEGGMLTQEGVSMGTPAYMSPEQALGEDTDARSDVYSLGILLYELAVGQLPFPARSLSEAIRYHTKEAPPPPSSRRPDLPLSVERVILKAITKDPAGRYPDAKALAAALNQVIPDLTQQDAPATAVEEVVSLATQYQSSLVAGRGSSILEEFPDTPSDLRADRIQIMDDTHTVRSVQFLEGGMTLGRDQQNNLVLEQAKISRFHARIDFNGQDYLVTDLDSTNGTYLGGERLFPGVAGVWTPEKVLQIGKFSLRLERSGGRASSHTTTDRRAAAGAGTFGAPALQSSGAGSDRMAVFVEMEHFSVAPGETLRIPVTILNQSGVVDQYLISVAGVDKAWVTLPEPVHLLPGKKKEAVLTIQPPRSPGSRAGRYPAVVRVTSADSPGEGVEARLTITLAPYYQFTSELQPRRLRAGQAAQVIVNNQGNIPETFTLLWQDEGSEIAFEPPQAQLKVPEGQQAAAEFRAAPQRPPWVGAEKKHSYRVNVTATNGEVQTRDGEISSRGRISPLVFSLLVALCMCIGLVGVLGVGRGALSIAQATQTAAAHRTATWESVALAVGGATATAEWLLADLDGDGLSNAFEQQLGTDPENDDTDGDGLPDNVEMDMGANPLDNDTDNDGVQDGAEVDRNIDPLDEDTDGDGLLDGEDPDPGQAPTATLTPTFTPTPTPTNTPTPSPTPEPVGAWSGEWLSSCSLLDCTPVRLNQTSDTVNGTFAGGEGRLDGTVEGRRMFGTWSYGGVEGSFDFWMDAGGEFWQGNWDGTYFWCGYREGDSEPSPCGLASWYGTWSSACGFASCGELTVIQTGRDFTGTYANRDGTVEGTVNGLRMNGTWRRGGSSGSFTFFMLASGQQFNGNYGEDLAWCGFRNAAGSPDPCYNKSSLPTLPIPPWLPEVELELELPASP